MSALKERVMKYIDILPDDRLTVLEPLLKLLAEGQPLEATVTPVDNPIRKGPRKSIEERFKGYTGDYKPAEIDWGKPVGRGMTASELKKLIEGHRKYVETVVKNETPEESRQVLIRTGVIDENGNIILRHGDEW